MKSLNLTRGDWRSKFITLSQLIVGAVALLGFFAFTTKQPLLLLGFAATSGLVLNGVVIFVIVALFAERALVEEAYGPGEVIFKQGEEGRHVYVVKSGNVEVIRAAPDGRTELARVLGPGEPFGELALLGKTPRNATIRTVNDVVVLKMGRSQFATLYTNLPGMRDHFTKVMESRLKELPTRRPN